MVSGLVSQGFGVIFPATQGLARRTAFRPTGPIDQGQLAFRRPALQVYTRRQDL